MSKLKRFNLYLSKEKLVRLKVIASQRDTSVANIIRQLINEFLKKN